MEEQKMDFLQHLMTPEHIAISTGIAGGIIGLALLGLIIWNRRTISSGVTNLRQNIFSQGGLFYVGMGLFMIASVVEAGPVLNKIAMHGALWGYGGHMLVFAFDMISAVSLRARLNAKRVFDRHGMQVQMWGIVLPAIVSIAANFAGAFQSFNPADFSHLWVISWVLPLIGAVFPSMIIVLSLAADHLLDTTAINDKIDPIEFKKQETKRVAILKVRLETEIDLLEEEKKIAAIRRDRDAAEGRASHAREWFWVKWVRPHVAPPMTAIKSEIERAVNEARTGLEQQTHTQGTTIAATLTSVQQQLAAITAQLVEQGDQLARLHLSDRDQRQQFITLKAQFEGVASTVQDLTTTDQLTHLADQITAQSNQLRHFDQSIHDQQQRFTAIANQLAELSAAQQHLSASHTQTSEQVARASARTSSPNRSVRSETVRLLSAMDNHHRNGHGSVHTDKMNEEGVYTEETESTNLKQHVADKWADMPEATAQQIADALGCSRSTAGKWMKIIREEQDQQRAKQAEGRLT
jgi:hypothetical protein